MEEGDENCCVICYEPFEGRSRISWPCGHEFCHCVLGWIKDGKSCPLCRGDIDISKSKKREKEDNCKTHGRDHINENQIKDITGRDRNNTRLILGSDLMKSIKSKQEWVKKNF